MEDQDTVYYRIYPDLEELVKASSVEDLLEELKAQCLSIVFSIAEKYIWQHEPFNLRVFPSIEKFSPGSRSRGVNRLEEYWENDNSGAELSSPGTFVPHLAGKLKFGDNLEDEWFVVYLLLAISRQFPSLSITVRDSDGEFLLIEAAYFIPNWLKPENSHNRVFLRRGSVHVVPPSRATSRSPRTSTTLKDSLQVLANGSVQTCASPEVQNVILERLADYPEKVQKNVHKVRCKVPASVAQVLTFEPQLIALAVESFYNRDMDAMKAASAMAKFPSKGKNGNEELVDIVVRMSRAMYAQLVQQVFQAPRNYPMPPLNSPGFKEAEIGMKIAVGFEMLYWERSSELLDSLAPEGDGKVDDMSVEDLKDQVPNNNKDRVPGNDVAWQKYRASLARSGYFRNALEGSKEYSELLQAAIAQYRSTDLFTRVSTAMQAPAKRIAELLSMPYNVDDFSNACLEQSDDDSWLYNGEEDLAAILHERQKEMHAYEAKQEKRKLATQSSASASDQMDLESVHAVEVVKGVQSFVNKISSFEGAEIPDKDHTGNLVDNEAVDVDMSTLLKELETVFDPKEISSMLSECVPNEDTNSSSDIDLDDYASGSEDENEADYSETAPQVEDAARSKDFVDLTDEGEKEDAAFSDEYSFVLEKELKSSSLGKSFAKGNVSENAPPPVTVEEIDPDDENDLVDVDVNLVDSLLRSYIFQQGMPGPASNLLGVMGIEIPDNADQRPGPSKSFKK